MHFIEVMLKIFPTAQIRCLCGDREFIGKAIGESQGLQGDCRVWGYRVFC